MPHQPDLTEWDDDVTVSEDEDYDALVRAIQWAQGFGLLFVQCSPAEGERLIERINADVTEKAIAVLRLEDEIEDLYEAVQAHPGINSTDVLFITGLEKSLTPYIQPGYGSEDGYHAKDTVPKLLGKLNLQREQFREDFPVCFVFVMPSYAMKYLSRRAADFFDWRSGIWEFAPSAEDRQKASQRILQEADYQKYLSWTPQQRRDRLFEIEELLSNPDDSTVDSSRLHFLSSEQRNVIKYSRLRYEQGNILLADKSWTEAVAAFDAALAIKPDYAYALNHKGLALNNLGRYEAAITTLDIALSIEPDHVPALNNKGWALNELGRYEAAVAVCDIALEIAPNAVDVLNKKGYALNELGRCEEAIAVCDVALKIKPGAIVLLNKKGYALNELERYEEAITVFDAALAIKPDYATALNNKGVALEKLGCYEEALTAHDASLASEPDYATAHNNKGYVFYRLGKYEAAVACYNKALSINPNHQNAIKNRKLALAALEPTFRYEQSAIRLIEEECAALTSKGARLHQRCRFQDAILVYDQALAKKADYYPALHQKGKVWAARGDQKSAIDCYDKALKINPDDHDILCDRGKALCALGLYEDALNDYDRALTIQPKSTKARYGKQEVRSSMTSPKVAPPASTHSRQPPQNFFQRCTIACAKLWTAFWNFTKSLFRL